MEEKYSFEFNVVELSTLVKSLKKLPYEESAGLIQGIITSVEKQQIEREKAAKAAKEKTQK